MRGVNWQRNLTPPVHVAVSAIYTMQNPTISESVLRCFAAGETEGIPESFDAQVPEFETFEPGEG